MIKAKDSSLIKNLKEVHVLLDEETPENIKAVINKVIHSPIITKALLESAHDTIKAEIKKLKNPNRKELLRYLTLIPFQLELHKINPADVDQGKKIQLFHDLRDMKRNKNTQQKYNEIQMEEGLTKGAPSGHIRHLSEEIKKLAYLLISNLH